MQSLHDNITLLRKLNPDINLSGPMLEIWRDELHNKNQSIVEKAIKRTYAKYSTEIKLPWVRRAYYEITEEEGKHRRALQTNQDDAEKAQMRLDCDVSRRQMISELEALGPEERMILAKEFRAKYCPTPFTDPGDSDPLDWSQNTRGFLYGFYANGLNGQVKMENERLVTK